MDKKFREAGFTSMDAKILQCCVPLLLTALSAPRERRASGLIFDDEVELGIGKRRAVGTGVLTIRGPICRKMTTVLPHAARIESSRCGISLLGISRRRVAAGIS